MRGPGIPPGFIWACQRVLEVWHTLRSLQDALQGHCDWEEQELSHVHSEDDLRSLFDDVLRVLLTGPAVRLQQPCHMETRFTLTCATDLPAGPLQELQPMSLCWQT